MIRTIDQAQTSKPQLATLVDKISSIFVPTVLLIATLTFCLWLFNGADISAATLAAISVLVISCPCALGLAIPMSIIVGTGQAAKLGILVKEANGLQHLSQVKHIFFDKTGTLTSGNTQVTAVWQQNSESVAIAAAIEQNMVHPLAQAIIQFAQQQSAVLPTIKQVNAIAGKGLQATIEQQKWLLGSLSFMQEQQVDLQPCQTFIQQQLQLAASLVFLANGKKVINVFAISD